jgi:hypothetical protein
MKTQRSRSALAAIAAVGITLMLTGCGGGGNSSAATTTTGVSTPPTTSGSGAADSSGACVTDLTGNCTTGDTSNGSTSSGSSISAWENSISSSSGGLANQVTNVQAVNVVEKDLSTIGQDFSTQADDTTLGADCEQLGRDVLAFPQPDSPDATVNDNFKKASDYLISGSTDCDVDNQSASTELNKAIDYMNTATARIKSLSGT